MVAKLSLAKLRALTSVVSPTELVLSSNYNPGIPCGQLSEVTGDAKFDWLFRLLAENKDSEAIWIEQKFCTLPTAAHQRGVDLNKVLFVDLQQDLFHSLRTAIRSQAFKIVIAPSEFSEPRHLIALRTLSKEANVATVLFGETPSDSWVFALKLVATLESKTKKLIVRDMDSNT